MSRRAIKIVKRRGTWTAHVKVLNCFFKMYPDLYELLDRMLDEALRRKTGELNELYS